MMTGSLNPSLLRRGTSHFF